MHQRMSLSVCACMSDVVDVSGYCSMNEIDVDVILRALHSSDLIRKVCLLTIWQCGCLFFNTGLFFYYWCCIHKKFVLFLLLFCVFLRTCQFEVVMFSVFRFITIFQGCAEWSLKIWFGFGSVVKVSMAFGLESSSIWFH